MNPGQITSFLDRLRGAQHFEDAASALLREAVNTAKGALARSELARRGQVLRAMAHLRPADGYRRLVIQDEAPPRGERAIPRVPSAGAWRWVVQRAGPVAIDVPLGRVLTLRDGAVRVLAEGGFTSSESIHRLTSRDVSHLLVVPIRSLRGAVEGMVSVEVGCPAAVGEDFLFSAVGDELQVLADVASPFLTGLPLRPLSAGAPDDLLPVIGETMAAIVEMLRIFAQQEETLLIGGPTGAGKSRLAQWCHARSPRAARTFEVVDLLTVPEDLQMAELCGWRKGAFTGAVRDTPGAVARAARGTLFIDEIDKLSFKAQAGLLHLLEARRYRPLGDTGREQSADVRFIVGSNVELFDLVKQGRFREDLYYRINVLPVKIPPLDERRDEIPAWARFMALRRHRESVPEGEVHVTLAAEQLLGEHAWPGNLRQLDNVIRRAYALALIGAAGGAATVVLGERHVAQALGYERSASRRTLLESLRAAASAFVDEAARLEERGQPLDLDLCDAFRGIVLGAAVERTGSRDAAFRLLGRAQQVQSRNHHKMLRRELEKVQALCKALGEEGSALFSGLDDEAP